MNIELFPCAGGMAEGFRRAGITFDYAFDYSEDAVASYEYNLGHRPVRMDVNDLLRMVEGGWRPGGDPIDFLCADPPCFPAGTMITTQRGRLPIQVVKEGDIVLTHAGRWRRVVTKMRRQYEGRMISVGTQYRPDPLTCTPEHPFYVRRRLPVRNRYGKNAYRGRPWTYGAPEWIAAHDLRIGDALLSPHTHEGGEPPHLTIRVRHGAKARGDGVRKLTLLEAPCRVVAEKTSVAWLLGLYVAEGHRRGREPVLDRGGLTRREVIFSIAKKEVVEVKRRLAEAGEHGIVTMNHGPGAARVVLNSPDWWALCGEFGDGAGAKSVPAWAIAMKPTWQRAFLEGYVFGDGHTGPNGGGGTKIIETVTVSEELAYSMARLVAVCATVVPSVQRGYEPMTTLIEGRTVSCRQQWRVRWSPPVGRRRPGEVTNEGQWLPVTSIVQSDVQSVTVYNMEVEDDNSYVAHGVAAHNCSPWSSAGKRMGTADERDMLEATTRLIALLRPRAALIGNVPGLHDATSWPVVQEHIGGLIRHGYCVRDYAQFDAADYGVPQRRIRPFWFVHRDGPCISWPLPTHGDIDPCQVQMPGTELLPWVTCRDALKHLPLEDLGRPVRVKEGPRGKGRCAVQPDGTRVPQSNRANELDEPSATVTTKPARKGAGQHAVLMVDGHVMANESATGGHWLKLPEREPNPNLPPADPDAPHRTVTGARDQALLEWTWNRPATTIQRDERMAPPGHHAGGSIRSEPNAVVRSEPNAVVLSERAASILQGFADGCSHEREWWADRSVDAWNEKRQRWLHSPAAAEPDETDEKAHAAWQRKRRKFSADAAPRDERFFSVEAEAPPRVCPTCGAQRRWRFIGATKSARWGMLGQAMCPGLSSAVAHSVRSQREAAHAEEVGHGEVAL